MVLFEINVESIAILELEGNTPRPIHRYCMPFRVMALQFMAAQARRFQLADMRRLVEGIKAAERSFVKFRVDPFGVSGLEKLAEPLMLEALYHVKRMFTQKAGRVN